LARNKVLFVDDEPLLLEALKRSMHAIRPDWEAAFETDPRQAAERVAQEAFAVVVSDISMPKMTGIELAGAIRKAAPRTRVIILTGNADLGVAISAINDADVFRFYTKPCPARELAAAIDAAMAEFGAAGANPAAIQLSEAALNRVPVGVVVVDDTAKVVFMNPQGAEIVAAKDGLTVGIDNALRGSSPKDTEALQVLIREVIDGGGRTSRAMALERPSMLRSYSILVSRLEQEGADTAGANALLFVTDPEHRLEVAPTVVARLFGLTASEARLAAALARGDSLDEAAEAIGVTLSTARTYLKQIFSKTGTGRQGELIRMILTSPALVSAEE
jgi:DNA-binding NarL/FixJ family response regulator